MPVVAGVLAFALAILVTRHATATAHLPAAYHDAHSFPATFGSPGGLMTTAGPPAWGGFPWSPLAAGLFVISPPSESNVPGIE